MLIFSCQRTTFASMILYIIFSRYLRTRPGTGKAHYYLSDSVIEALPVVYSIGARTLMHIIVIMIFLCSHCIIIVVIIKVVCWNNDSTTLCGSRQYPWAVSLLLFTLPSLIVLRAPFLRIRDTILHSSGLHIIYRYRYSAGKATVCV